MVATALPYSIWMMKNFMDDVPTALEEAAWIEGAGALTTISRVIFPDHRARRVRRLHIHVLRMLG